MKTLFTLFIIITTMSLSAQIPAGLNYQAVVKNSSGSTISNSTVSYRFSIIEGSENGNPVYSETQSAATNSHGVVALIMVVIY